VSSLKVSIRKRDLEIALQSIAPHRTPRIHLEQYTTPAHIAADILFRACYIYEDVRGRSVLDLGTGTGRFAIGAAILGADQVVGIDLDVTSVHSALSYSKGMQLKVDWVVGDIEIVRDLFDTVIMNPPFGTRQEHADLRFLRAALSVGKVIYSIHKSTTRAFMSRWLKNAEAKSEILMTTKIVIPHQYNFHHKHRHVVDVDVLRIVRG